MAEAAVFSVVQTVLNQLSSELIQEAAVLWGAGDDDIKKLTLTLSTIQPLLLDAVEKSHSPYGHELRLWFNELREAVYDAEDLLDGFSTEVLRRLRVSKEVPISFSSSDQLAYGLKMGNEIRAIRVRLDEIAARRGVLNLNVTKEQLRGRQTDSDVPDVVVGREDDKNRIIELLLGQTSEVPTVVSIVGIGGLGKTVLAQLVFNDQRVDSHFDDKVWVCVSGNFDLKLMVEKIVESCTMEKLLLGKEVRMDAMKELLGKHLKSKRYLIVLDDVWEEDRKVWSRLKSLLLDCGAEGSRVVITTRLRKVAKLATSTRINRYELKGLNKSDSWSLFRRFAFEGGEVASPEKQEWIGKEILVKCKGVPLAIKTVAGDLLFKESESKWVAAFKDKDIWKTDHHSENDIMSALKLSYDRLPVHLKCCFAYCRLFPKGHKFDVKKLVKLWVAQGYVKTKSDSLMNKFDLGVKYFKDLLSKLFFRDAANDELGNVESCRMHDLMHDLAILVAGEEAKTMTLDISDSSNSDQNSHDASYVHGVRHFSFYLETGTDLSRSYAWRNTCDVKVLLPHWTLLVSNADKLRTLFWISPRLQESMILLCTLPPFQESIKNREEITFSRRTSLRALDLSHFMMSLVSHTIHKLKHLRYLNLSYNCMKMLPEEITELVNLEVLELEGCMSLEQLPISTGNLMSLSHLGLLECDSLKFMPPGIGRLSRLRELPVFTFPGFSVKLEVAARAAGIWELRYLNNLRGSLTIENLKWVKDPSEGDAANLREKEHLEQLALKWGAILRSKGDDDDDDVDAEGKLLEALCPHPNLKVLLVSDNGGFNCPTWLPSLTGLVEITINNSKNWKHLLPLDHLPLLAKLKLKGLKSLEWVEISETTSNSPSSFFPSLKSLWLMDCPKLEGWSIPGAEGAVLPEFACVSSLHITNCHNITSLPRFSNDLKAVHLCEVDEELLELVLRVPSSGSRSHLESLNLAWIYELDNLPEEIFPTLSSLKTLSICECENLTSLYPALPYHLTSLQDIEIERCERLVLRGDFQCRCNGGTADIVLPRLSKVKFEELQEVYSLPGWLQYAPSLRELTVLQCPIRRIPKWMRYLTQLKELTISDYGKSAAKCVAQDLKKVRHIPRVEIGEVLIYEGRVKGHWVGREEEEEKVLEEDDKDKDKDKDDDDDEEDYEESYDSYDEDDDSDDDDDEDEYQYEFDDYDDDDDDYDGGDDSGDDVGWKRRKLN